MAITALIPRLKTPGVYVEEIPKLPPSIAQVETAIPAFIGYTEKAIDGRGESLTDTPYRITSLLEYEKYFGRALAEKGSISVDVKETRPNQFELNGKIDPQKRSRFLMYYAMQMFFNNGGGPCWIVSVGDYSQPEAGIQADALKKGLAETERINEITLYVFPDAQGLTTAADFYDVYNAAIAMCVKLQDRFTVMDVWQDTSLDWKENIKTFRAGTPVEIDETKYAAAYYPNLKTILDFWYGEEGTDTADENIIITGSRTGTLKDLKSTDNALYFQVRNAIRSIPCEMPPSAAIVGIYARVDASRGVWKAPANVSLRGVIEPVKLITHEEQQDLNVDVVAGKSINAIRVFSGRGTLVWGARTLAGNDNEWRYIPVRRFFNMVEESTKNAAFRFVFEPNDVNTWTRVRSMIENFLSLQWRAGALQGATTEEAYYVRVGLGETMTELDIWEGRMIVEIGMAVVRPAEFIILQFSHKMLSAEG